MDDDDNDNNEDGDDNDEDEDAAMNEHVTGPAVEEECMQTDATASATALPPLNDDGVRCDGMTTGLRMLAREMAGLC